MNVTRVPIKEIHIPPPRDPLPLLPGEYTPKKYLLPIRKWVLTSHTKSAGIMILDFQPLEW